MEDEPRITSAMNFHSFGNLWIHPFNYMITKEGYPENLDPSIINFYNRFKEVAGLVSSGSHGNAFETVGYAASGEGSDWMLGEHKIVAFSPELGSKNPEMNVFWAPKNLIYEGIMENYQIIKLFLEMNIFDLVNLSFGFDNKDKMFLGFENHGLAELFDAVFIIESDNRDFIELLKCVKIEIRSGEILKMKLEKLNAFQVSVSAEKMYKLSKNRLVFGFLNSKMSQTNFKLNILLKSASGVLVSEFVMVFEDRFNFNQIGITFSMIYLGLIFVSTIFIVHKICKKNVATDQS